jgi:hypothetical protein
MEAGNISLQEDANSSSLIMLPFIPNPLLYSSYSTRLVKAIATGEKANSGENKKISLG